MFNDCTKCANGKLCQFTLMITLIRIPARIRMEIPDKHVTKVRISVPFEEAVDKFKQSVVNLKKHIYTKRQTYNQIKECLDHGKVLVHVDYAEPYKNVQQNETQSAYFKNSNFSIFKACCYTKSLDDINGLKKDSIIVISESKQCNKTAALTCLKKVTEETEKINVAKYNKIMV